ncbi:hypothetical protein GCM10022296_13290 [Secundilactobacillus similis DSM 23365 = JCM 2765]|uniref:Phage protein Gp138 N-terminal domain-containing protein n=1 Tax=Secundilactobacillus similis DSM 23365 = JCM 2765 TaxID=1423804 RepID=A0A0R2EZQ1_9LACO|nr:hypothetical protein [Secundilactobacillus similis]KRN20667.1 hypothetical protein FD14_GL001457 [Secundilactobacillus similis DSM 23365 = JCM 2765]
MKESKLQETFHELMEQHGNKANYDINVANMATVISYDAKRHVADVQPSVSDAGGQDDVGVINECPVLYPCYAVDELRDEIIKLADGNLKQLNKRETMKVGATVYIVFNDRDLDNFSGTGTYTKASDRTHSVNDAVVVGVKEP